jgi:thiol-disulfide isomerase/thioredoxin
MSTNVQPTSTYLNSFNQKINNNKYTIILIIVLLFVAFITYYVYTKYYSSKLLELYKPNNEKMPVWTKDGNTNEVELMFFFANWCPHCKTAKPEWEKAKTQYNNTIMDGYKILFIDVDCTQPDSKITAMMDKYNIEGYPTIILIKNNEVITYDAKVTYDHLVQFLKTAL